MLVEKITNHAWLHIRVQEASLINSVWKNAQQVCTTSLMNYCLSSKDILIKQACWPWKSSKRANRKAASLYPKWKEKYQRLMRRRQRIKEILTKAKHKKDITGKKMSPIVKQDQGLEVHELAKHVFFLDGNIKEGRVEHNQTLTNARSYLPCMFKGSKRCSMSSST